jgi:hypothetical protein
MYIWTAPGHWFVIRDKDGIDPRAITLRELTELDQDSYERVMVLSGLCRSSAKGLEVIKKEWDGMLKEFSDGATYIHCFIPVKAMVVKLGAKNAYGYDSAKLQLKELKQKPRIQQLLILRSELRNTLSFHTE